MSINFLCSSGRKKRLKGFDRANTIYLKKVDIPKIWVFLEGLGWYLTGPK